MAEHVIEIGDAQPIKVPACPVAFHLQECVHTKLQEMTDTRINNLT